MNYIVVIQYSPDPYNLERINFGVCVLSNGQAKFRFLQNWNRVEEFAGTEVEFLKNRAIEFGYCDEASILHSFTEISLSN